MVCMTIVGLKPGLARLVEDRFGNDMRLTYLPASRSKTRLPNGTDWVILSQFTGHRWTRAALNQLPRDRVVFCAGGVLSVMAFVSRVMMASGASPGAA